MRLLVLLRCGLVLATIGSPALAADEDCGPFGKYDGAFDARFLPDGRTVRLLSTLKYKDPNCVEWVAPEGSVVDGASIPRAFWSLIGGPYEGKYRDASAIHDVACEKKSRPWQNVHLAFYYAMKASGVDTVTAKMMYAAVYHFGPRWEGRRLKGTIEPTRKEQSEIERLVRSLDRSAPYEDAQLNAITSLRVGHTAGR